MLPHVSISFPARNIGYEICLLRISIYVSAPSAADIGYGIAPRPCLSIRLCNPEIWIWDRPRALRGCGICPLRPPDPSEISSRQYLSIAFPSPKYRIVSIYPFPPAAADIGCGILPHVSIYLSPFPARNIGYGICASVSIYPPLQPQM